MTRQHHATAHVRNLLTYVRVFLTCAGRGSNFGSRCRRRTPPSWELAIALVDLVEVLTGMQVGGAPRRFVCLKVSKEPSQLR